MGEPTDDPGEPLGMESELTGSVGDGPIVNASMRILTADGAILSEFESDAFAGYSVKVRANNNDYPLIIDAWSGTDLVTGLSPDFAMRGAGVKPGSKLTANVNPYSTLAVEVALDLDGGLTTDNIEIAQAIVASAANGGMTTLLAEGPMFTPIDGNNIAEVVRATESLAEVVRRARNWQVAFGFSTNADLVMEALGSDLIDQVIDGVGGPRSNARTAAVSTVVGAQVLLESMSNELHVNGSNATAAMQSAIQQVSSSSVSRDLSDLTVTAEMLDQVRTGLTAAAVVSSDPALTQLRTAVAGIQPGLGPTLVKSILPPNYRQTLENIMSLVAGADDATIAAINDVARTGGSDPQVNRAPTINGTPAAQVAAGMPYSFTPVASDLDGDTLTFNITGMPAWLSFSQSTGVLSGTPSSANGGSFNNIIIRVTDGEATASLPAFSITVTVPTVNSPPAISGTPSTATVVGTAYAFTPTVFDADSDALTFTITGRPAWASFNAQTGALTGTPGAAGTFSNIVISVSDGQATTSLPAFAITVTALPVNTPPTISGTPTTSVMVGSAYSFTPNAFDAEGTALTFTITGRPGWASFNAQTGALTGTPGAAGTFSNIVISVSDGQATTSLPAFAITVTAVPVNTPPTISGTPSTAVMVGSAYSFTPNGFDAEGTALSFTITGRPGWASFNAQTGALTGTPGAAGTFSNIVISVSDGQATTSLPAFGITVSAVPVNTPPTISGTPSTSVMVGSAYSFTPNGFDAEGTALSFTITGRPGWASFNAQTGALTGTPGAAGTFSNIVIRVSDGQATTSLPAFGITVTALPVNTPPTISGTPTTSVMVGSAYSFTPNGFDAEGTALTFTITGRPGWASFNSQTGALTGTPGAAGTFSNIVISVSDGQATTSLPAFAITVTALPVNTPPTISGSPAPQVNVGQAYAFTPTAFDANGNALTFSITGRPTWLSFSTSTGRLSGTPASGDAGIHGNIVISVSDGQATASLAAFSITVVTPNRPPTISGTPPSTVNVNTPYSFTPTANDLDGNSLSFTASGLPVWATFNSANGQISGMPGAANVGNYTGIRITVSDGSASAVLGPFSIAVQAVSLGSVTLSWTAPTQNEDGTPLTDLAGYKFYWGTTPGNYPNSVTVNNAGITTYVVDNLSPGTYEFVARSYNTSGTESEFSNPATRTVP